MCELDVDAAAQDFGVGVGRFSKEILVVRSHRKQGGIDARQRTAKALHFVSSQAYGDVYALVVVIEDTSFDARNIVVGLYHALIFDTTCKKYTLFRTISTQHRLHKPPSARIG